MATSKASQMDQKAKTKLIASSAVLAIAVVWIIVYLASSGPSAAPERSPEEVRQMDEEHAQKVEEIKKETESYRGAKNQGPPSGS